MAVKIKHSLVPQKKMKVLFKSTFPNLRIIHRP